MPVIQYTVGVFFAASLDYDACLYLYFVGKLEHGSYAKNVKCEFLP